MDSALADLLPFDRLEAIYALPFGEFWLATVFLGLTASIYASGIPGALLPISFSSGALLGGILGAIPVALGAMVGAMVLYALGQRCSQASLQERHGRHLARLDSLAARGGILPIIGLRLAGVPHFAVTALCVLARVGPRRYALATLIGILPAIALSATAGAAV